MGKSGSGRKRRQEAKKKAREEWEAKERHRKRSRLLRVFIGVMGLVGLVTIGVFVLTHSWSNRERVTGELTGLHELYFVPGAPKHGGVSPVCGCFKPHPNAWRGITFATREAILSRKGSSSMTEWTISGAEARERMQPVPAVQSVAAEVAQINPDGRFDPAWMVKGELAQHGHVLDQRSFKAFRFSIINNGRLHVSLLGNVPIGSWIPLPGSHVHFVTDQSSFPGLPPRPRITEYPVLPLPEVRMKHHRVQGQGYPIGDFLGPDLVLWSSTPFIEVSGPPYEQERPGLITAVLLKGSTFSTRIAAVPLSRQEVFAHMGEVVSGPHQGRELIPVGRPDGGEIRVDVTKPLGSRAYAKLRRQVLEHPVVHMSPLTRIGLVSSKDRPYKIYARQTVPLPERDRYPPLPRQSGLNVFGPLHGILFRGVHGHLLVGAHPKGLYGSSDLRLTDVAGLENDAGEEVILAPLSTSAASAALRFRAVGEVKINGASETDTSFMEEWHAVLAALSFLFALLGTLFGAYAFLRERTADSGELRAATARSD